MCRTVSEQAALKAVDNPHALGDEHAHHSAPALASLSKGAIASAIR